MNLKKYLESVDSNNKENLINNYFKYIDDDELGSLVSRFVTAKNKIDPTYQLPKPPAKMRSEDWKQELKKYYMDFDIQALKQMFDLDDEE